MSKGYTEIITGKMNDWGLEKIYEIEDDLNELENKAPEIVSYLSDIHYSMPLGLALRRLICEKYSDNYDETSRVYSFSFGKKSFMTKDYRAYAEGEYDIEKDELDEYIEIFNIINQTYNKTNEGTLVLEISKAEVRRQLKSTGGCLRKKMFLLSFALHMDNSETSKFLTDVLAEQTYNYREPEEIIALFCQSHERFNNYNDYLRLCDLYKNKSVDVDDSKEKTQNYTVFAQRTVNSEIESEEELIEFLLANVQNFHLYSETAYNEFMILYDKAISNSKYQSLSNNEYIEPTDVSMSERAERIKKAIALTQVTNPEQLAGEILQCIPRASSERIKDGKKIISNDFINIYNGESGQKNKKVKTTSLPKKITMNLPISDRLWDLIRKTKPVERKDLVFMKFYVFSKYLETKDEYSTTDYFVFMDECNDMLVRCGMSRLYPGNRFENLVMLSLLASNPYEMFENIIEYSFMNEPKFEDSNN